MDRRIQIYKIARKYQSPNVHRRYKTVLQKLKRIGNPHKGSENIQSGHQNGIRHRKIQMLIIKSGKGKRHITENKNAWRKGNIEILRKIESGHHQTSGVERKKF